MGKLSSVAAMMIILGFGIGVVFSNCSSSNHGKEEKIVKISEVPEVVMETALNSVKGIHLAFAEIKKENGIVVYKLKGNLDDKVYEFRILQNGTLLKVQLKTHVGKNQIERINTAAKDPERNVVK